MTIELIKKNSEEIGRLADEIRENSQQLEDINSRMSSGEQIDLEHKKLLEESINHALSQIKLLNNAFPDLISGISFYPKLSESSQNIVPAAQLTAEQTQPVSKSVENLSFTNANTGAQVSLAIRKKDRNKFLESLSLHRLSISKLFRKKSSAKETNQSSLDKYASLIKLSNKMFRNLANKLVAGGTFDPVRADLIKITSPMILNSYLAIALFCTMIMLFAGILLGGVLALLGVNILLALLLVIACPIITFMLFVFYPSSKRKSLEKDINQELPFLVIYMSAISTSGIEPSKIFNIIVGSKDYPSIQREIKKLTNYVNFYGLDLVAALKNVSKNNPSEKLGQLFDGLATTITSGGELTEFLNKHSESLLFDYRLEREKYTRTAETFMNIYISVVIAAPMILMMLFILMSLGGLAQGFMTPTNLGILAVLGISLLNMAFLVFLSMKQPKF